MSEPKRSFTGRKTPASTGTKIKTAWSDVVTIISVLLFFTARIESTVGSEKKTYYLTFELKSVDIIEANIFSSQMNTPVELMRQKIIAARPPESQSKRKSIIYHVRVSQNSNTKWIYLESRKKTRPTVLHYILQCQAPLGKP